MANPRDDASMAQNLALFDRYCEGCRYVCMYVRTLLVLRLVSF